MKNLLKLPKETPLMVGSEMLINMQYSGRELSSALLEYSSDYHSAPIVELDDCRDTVEILFCTEYPICNYQCPYCLIGWSPGGRREWLQKDMFPKIINRLSQFKHKLKLNLENWGEWFTSKELIDGAVFLCQRENIVSVSITTNASRQKQMFDFLDNVDVSKVSFTCSYHATEVTLQDFIKQIEALRQRGPQIIIALLIYPDNLEHCVELKHYAMSQGIYVRANHEFAQGTWVKKNMNGKLTEEQLENLYFLYEDHMKWDAHRKGGLLKINKTAGEWCTAGQSYLWLNGYSDIFICASAMSKYSKSIDNPDVYLGNIFDIENDYLPSRHENICCPFAICGCPKDYTRQVTLMEIFDTGEQSRHEVSFKSDEQKNRLLQLGPVRSL